ncbi:MAG: GntR family transcriptional regulator [bacterium]|nr:GntR family transcriptional regulator [bacterium]
MTVIRSDARVSLYLQLYDIIKENILSGKYHPDEKIPSARELSETHNVSRITVEKAIEVLVQENLIYRVQGKGSFVTSTKLHRSLPKLYSFSEDMRELGLVPGSHVLELRVEEAGEHIRNVLRLPANLTQVTKLARVRLVNDEPILIETTYIPVYLCPGLVECDFEKGSLYQTLDEQYHLTLEYAEEHYEITRMKAREADLLQCREDTCAFSIERLTFLETNRQIEYTRAIGRGDRLHFTVKLVRNADTPFTRRIEV